VPPAPPSSLDPPGRCRRSRPTLGALALLALAALVPVGCGPGAPTPAPRPAIAAEELRYLVPPSTGAPPGIPAEDLRDVDAAFQSRLLAGNPSGAAAAADELLKRDADSAAARTLLGQARLVGGDLSGARTVLETVTARYPTYTAAQLALGRAADRVADAVAAYAAYRQIATASPAAGQRAGELQRPAMEQLSGRVTEALGRSRPDLARESLAQMEAWAPGDRNTLQAEAAVSRAVGDQRGELQAVRALLAGGEADETLMARRGELEVEVGQPAAAIQIFQDLARRHPEDAQFPQQVERAKFRFRVANLPADVQRLVEEPELSRADYAVLLYWLVPGVRAAVVSSAHIATDVLEHPRRQEIIRVVNLELMDVDDRLRQFNPDARLRRSQALKALVRVLQRSQPPAACVGALGGPSPSREALCGAATACGLLHESADCLPDAGVPGSVAADWIRQTLSLLPAS